MIQAAEALGKDVGVSEACCTLDVPRRSLYRARKSKADPKPRPTPPRALSAEVPARLSGDVWGAHPCAELGETALPVVQPWAPS